MRQAVDETREVARLELLHLASIHSDLDAWAAFQQSLEETVMSWFNEHPGREAACHLQSEQYFIALAFDRLLQATIRGQVSCESLSQMLVFLCVSLNGAILETLRDSKRPGVDSSTRHDGEDRLGRSELWEWLQAWLSNRREQRLAYLLYHCGLEPAEIVRYCPQEWGNVQEVIHLRRSILLRIMKRPEL